MLSGKKLLIIAPHPDDEVLGCGGLIQHVKKNGGKVYVLYLTVGDTKEWSTNGYSTREERIKEIERVAEFMKFDRYRLAFPGNDYHLRLDTLPQKQLIDEIERGPDVSLTAIQPDIIAAPLATHYNQDHRVAAWATFAATRPMPEDLKPLQRTVISYEQANDSWHPYARMHPNVFIELSEEELETKVTAINLYRSQVRTSHHPRSNGSIRCLASLRGAENGVAFAEAYHGHRILLT